MESPGTVLVTGSTSGIGREVALALAKIGHFVVVSGRDEERGVATIESIKSAGGRAALVLKDLARPEGPAELADLAKKVAGGHIDILVNNAAGGFYALSDTTTSDDFERVFSLNTRAPALLIAALAPEMAKRGRGIIVNVTAVAGALGLPGLSLFGASKAALAAMTRTWAAEYGPSGVRVNAVEIGAISTPDNIAAAAARESFTRSIPHRRPGTAEEAAAVIIFLVSPGASYLNGVVLPVDGGSVISSPMALPEKALDSENLRKPS